MPEATRVWFYSGRNAQVLAVNKVSGIPGAKALSREDAKKKRFKLPTDSPEAPKDWAWVVVAPVEPEPEPGE